MFNPRRTNPNPHIKFICPLPAPPNSQKHASHLLDALAAQVRPVMKSHGFSVGKLEEYEYNPVFAGRNWNNGEVVELVLRRANGGIVPTSYLISTFCHELAHIKHMNHGPAFQALWVQLRKEVRELQNKGYYGDGFWSSGTRLKDASTIPGSGLAPGDFPEYMCGGAQTRARPKGYGRHRHNSASQSIAGPSNHTGAQTAKKRKAGSRVKTANAFKGSGKALNEDLEDERKRVGTGFGKQAASKRAREERALAVEKRINALRTDSSIEPPPTENSSVSDPDDDIQIKETDEDRRHALGRDQQKTSWDDFADDFNVPELAFDGDEDGERCDSPTAFAIGSSSSAPGMTRGEGSDRDDPGPVKRQKTSQSTKAAAIATPSGLGGIVQTEMHLRRNESLGLTGSGRKLGTRLWSQGSK